MEIKKGISRLQTRNRNIKKGYQHLFQERRDKYEFIRNNRNNYSVEKMCNLLMVSRSSFYEFTRNKTNKRKLRNQHLLKEIKFSFKESKQTYGSPRITSCLRDKGIDVSEVTIAKLMRKNDIKSVSKKKFIATTNSKHDYQVSANLLNRNFTVQGPSQAWVSDITYIRTQQGWIYLTTVIDLFDRKIIGRSISDKMDA